MTTDTKALAERIETIIAQNIRVDDISFKQAGNAVCFYGVKEAAEQIVAALRSPAPVGGDHRELANLIRNNVGVLANTDMARMSLIAWNAMSNDFLKAATILDGLPAPTYGEGIGDAAKVADAITNVSLTARGAPLHPATAAIIAERIRALAPKETPQ